MITPFTPPYTRVKYAGKTDDAPPSEIDLIEGVTYLFMGMVTNPERTKYNKGKYDVVLMRDREVFTATVKAEDLEVL